MLSTWTTKLPCAVGCRLANQWLERTGEEMVCFSCTTAAPAAQPPR